MRRNEKFLTAMAAAFMTTAAVSFSSMAAVDTDFHRFVVGTINQRRTSVWNDHG